ncbi:hypothetical protein HMPREF9373_0595 [Psychrobacter sp. 1501(2011)]|nr:hypothetical protein HMPREF9373_0595 [Psychrobacter sp. 1501(2011)]
MFKRQLPKVIKHKNPTAKIAGGEVKNLIDFEGIILPVDHYY